MLSAGLNTGQAIAATETAMAVAKGTMGDAIPTAQLLATIYNTLGNKTADVKTEMTRLGDVLVATQAQYQIANMDALIQGMTYGVPAAVQFGMSVEQTAAAIGQLNSLGLQGSMAGTAFASSMSKMNKASKKLGFQIARTADGGVDFIGTIENIKAKFGDQLGLPKVQERMRKAFGQEGLRAITLLTSQTNALRAGYDGVSNSAGKMVAAQATIEDTTSQQMAAIKNQITDVAISFGTVLVPEIRKAMPKITAAMGMIGQNWDGIMTGVKAAAAAYLTVAVPTMMIKAATTIMAHPAIAAVAAAAAAATAAAAIVDQAQVNKQRERIRETGVRGDLIFTGSEGAAAAAAALDKEQAERRSRNAAAGRAAPTQAEVERSILPQPIAADVFTPEVAGNISITFANAPAGMQVGQIVTNSPDLGLTVKGDTGRNRTGSGGL